MDDMMKKIISLCKKRGFIFQSSEIYGGFPAVYDYGHYGVQAVKSIKDIWQYNMVQLNQNIFALDSAIFMHPKIWEASGHVGNFSDPLIVCKNCNSRIRVDKLLNDLGIKADDKMSLEEIKIIFDKNNNIIKCPDCGKHDFSEIKEFNLLVKSNLGNFIGDENKEPSYLRGETCQGIFVNFLNIVNSYRTKIPFGVAQVGKAFRNEITARNFIFRTREFEQMEMQYFVDPEKEMIEYEKWREKRWNYYIDLGLKKENLSWYKHEKLAFYANAAHDVYYKFPFGFDEIEGIHARGNYDLSQHSKFSNKKLVYHDMVNNKKYTPHVVESSSGVGRVLLALLCEAYTEEKLQNSETRIVMKFPKKIAPVKVAVFPLVKNNSDIVNLSKTVYEKISRNFMTEFDDNSNIGKRYRRQDEIGTPFCVVIDHESLEDNNVSIRDRDTMIQERVSISKLDNFLNDKFKNI